MIFMQTRYGTYQITSNAMPANEMDALPAEVNKELTKIHASIRKGKCSKSSIKKLEELHQRFPQVKVIANFLSNTYSFLRHPKSDEFVEQMYKLYPDYLFACTNYADLCLRKGDTKTVKKIFKGDFDLRLLYPDRDLFHLSEFLAISSLACHYFAQIGDNEKVLTHYKVMHDLAPEHPVIKSTKKLFIVPDILNALTNEVFKASKNRNFLA